MFRPKQKRHFPAGTFIPTLPRVCAIIQLCMAFTLLLSIILQPYLGDLFAIKSQMLYYEAVLHPDHKERFSLLPYAEQKSIQSDYTTLKAKLQLPFSAKVKRSAELLFTTSPWMLAWLLFSLVIAIFLLLRIEGAQQVVWLLPLLAALYAIDNRLNGMSVVDNRAVLFPAETEIVTSYLNEPLSSDIFEQQRQLTLGWKRYVIQNWAHEVPASDDEQFERQFAQGSFAFAIVQLPNRADIDQLYSQTATMHQDPWLLLVLYILWNSIFALIASRAAGNAHISAQVKTKGAQIHGIASRTQ